MSKKDKTTPTEKEQDLPIDCAPGQETPAAEETGAISPECAELATALEQAKAALREKFRDADFLCWMADRLVGREN